MCFPDVGVEGKDGGKRRGAKCDPRSRAMALLHILLFLLYYMYLDTTPVDI